MGEDIRRNREEQDLHNLIWCTSLQVFVDVVSHSVFVSPKTFYVVLLSVNCETKYNTRA